MRSFVEATLVLALLAPPAWGQRCESCHATQRDPRLRGPAAAVEASVHRGPLVGCVGCHGGRADEAQASAHDPAAGFVARPSAAEAVERCGACHADARFLRRAGVALQVDQLALFRADPHGLAVADGRPRAPSCVACHGAHDVVRGGDRASPVHPSRVADTCGRCHEGPDAVRGRRPEGQRPTTWRGSVHGRAALQGHEGRSPTCAGCHGAHGAQRLAGGPDARCGHCHPDEAAAAARSPHPRPFARLGFGTCVPCHGSHAVGEADGALLGGGAANVCARCHRGAQRASSSAERLNALRAEALRSLDVAEDAVHAADRAGLSLPEALARLEEARSARRRLDVALHTLDEARVGEVTAEVRRSAQASREVVRRTLARRARQRRGWGWAAGLFTALGVLLALRARARDEGDP
ncbi:MAG: cytochrome c3 family protein [Deltaproteobacteria bacterium]|nr:cytochrome c3 family protein [Deltaproteobacteria bacterium]